MAVLVTSQDWPQAQRGVRTRKKKDFPLWQNLLLSANFFLENSIQFILGAPLARGCSVWIISIADRLNEEALAEWPNSEVSKSHSITHRIETNLLQCGS